MRVDASQFSIQHNPSAGGEESKFYTRKNDAVFTDDNNYPRLSVDSDKVYAKAIKDKPSKNFTDKNRVGYSYYIKSAPNKILFNPLDLHTIEPKVAKSFINKICKTELMFLEVSESVFNMYLNFLKTENTQWLSKAQREIK